MDQLTRQKLISARMVCLSIWWTWPRCVFLDLYERHGHAPAVSGFNRAVSLLDSFSVPADWRRAAQRVGVRLRLGHFRPTIAGCGVRNLVVAGASSVMSRRTSPQPATMSQPGRDASARSVGGAPTMTPPATAMPRAEPNWRALEVIPPATPAWAGGK